MVFLLHPKFVDLVVFYTQAGANCRALGARTALPHRTDPRLASFLS